MIKRLFSLFFLSLLLFKSSCLFSEEQIEQKLKKYIVQDVDKSSLVGYLELEKEHPIDKSSFIEFKFALEYFKKRQVDFILLRLNTPGGEVFSALKMAKLLQDIDRNDHIPVVAFIDNWAVSAGAMLAYSCRFIATTNSSIMGAAEPVISTGSKMESASEKVNSAIRSEFNNLARFYDRDPLIAEAMVDKDMILVKRSGQFAKLTNEEEIRSTDQVISAEGKLLTLNAKQLLDFGVADFEVPFAKLPEVTPEENQEGIYPFSTSLLSAYPFFSNWSDAKLITYRDWRVNFFSFLSHPFISSVLVIGLMIGFYLEVNTPGFGVFGSIAIACLFLILLSSFSIYAIDWIEVIILISALVLIGLEVFVIPGFGVAGVLGILLLFLSLITLMLPNLSQISFSITTGTMNLAAIEALRILVWLTCSFILGFIIIVILSKYFMPKLYALTPLIHKGEQDRSKGFFSKLSKMPKVGQKGITISSLRPSGKIEIDDQVYDVIAERGFIQQGKSVTISLIDGNKILVREI